MVEYIEKAIEEKEPMTAAVLDTERKFSNTTRNSTDNAMAFKGVPVSVRKWTTGMLNDRCVYSEWMGKMVYVKINEECLQGE